MLMWSVKTARTCHHCFDPGSIGVVCLLQEEELQERKARAAAAAEGRKERDAGRRKALARKVPVTAMMSQQQRARVEAVLAQLRDTQLVSSIHDSTGGLLHRLCVTLLHVPAL